MDFKKVESCISALISLNIGEFDLEEVGDFEVLFTSAGMDDEGHAPYQVNFLWMEADRWEVSCRFKDDIQDVWDVTCIKDKPISALECALGKFANLYVPDLSEKMRTAVQLGHFSQNEDIQRVEFESLFD